MGKFQEYFIDLVFFGDAVPVEFHVKIGSKLFFPPHKSLFCLRFPHIEDEVRDLSPNASRGSDQVSFVLN